MDRTARARRRVGAIMRTFPSEECAVSRPAVDEFGSETGEMNALGTLPIWREGVNRPSKWVVGERAQLSVDTAETWVAILRTDSTPQVRHGDSVTFPDGTVRRIRAMVSDGVSEREFWLLTEG